LFKAISIISNSIFWNIFKVSLTTAHHLDLEIVQIYVYSKHCKDGQAQDFNGYMGKAKSPSGTLKHQKNPQST
jgi:hypothetical protein